MDERNPLHINTLKNNYTYNKIEIGIGPALSHSQVHLRTAPQSLTTAILNAFSNNNIETDFKHSN